jgi:hypothetical protein
MEVLEGLRSDMAEVKRRTNAIENARVEARSSYDANWNDVKIRLERIEFQTTRTNGRVSLLETGMIELGKLVAELREWKSYMGGVAASFSWWKPALKTITQRANTIKRCGRCKCLLARDQDNHYCSPCQRGFSDMPEAVADYLE